MRPMQFMPLIKYLQDKFSDRADTPPTAAEWKVVMAYLQVNKIQKDIEQTIHDAVMVATADAQTKADAAVVAVVAALPDAPPDLVAIAADAAPDEVKPTPDIKPENP